MGHEASNDLLIYIGKQAKRREGEHPNKRKTRQGDRLAPWFVVQVTRGDNSHHQFHPPWERRRDPGRKGRQNTKLLKLLPLCLPREDQPRPDRAMLTTVASTRQFPPTVRETPAGRGFPWDLPIIGLQGLVVTRVSHRCEPERNRVLICESHVRFRRIARVSCAGQLTPPVMMCSEWLDWVFLGSAGSFSATRIAFSRGMPRGNMLPPDGRPRSRLAQTLFLSAGKRNLERYSFTCPEIDCAPAWPSFGPPSLFRCWCCPARQSTAAAAQISRHVNCAIKRT